MGYLSNALWDLWEQEIEYTLLVFTSFEPHRNIRDPSQFSNPVQYPGPIFCLLLRVSSDYAQPITRPGYWSNLPCHWPSTAWAYSEQETENGPWCSSWDLSFADRESGVDFLHAIIHRDSNSNSLLYQQPPTWEEDGNCRRYIGNISLNSLRPSDAYMILWSNLVAPSHYLYSSVRIF